MKTIAQKYCFRYISNGPAKQFFGKAPVLVVPSVRQQVQCHRYSYKCCQRYVTAVVGNRGGNGHYWRRKSIPTMSSAPSLRTTRRCATTGTESPNTIATKARRSDRELSYKVFADHFHRMNSTNTAFLRQYYTLLKMERQLHQLCHQYLQCLHVGQQQASPSSEGKDLFLKLLHDNTNHEGTTKPVKITELPTPSKLLLLPQLLRLKILLSYDASVYHSTESLYQDIVNLANEIGVSWCNIPTTISMPTAASAPSSFSNASNAGETTTSNTEDSYSNLEETSDYYIPCTVLRAQRWLNSLEKFCAIRKSTAQSVIGVPASTDYYDPHGSRSHKDTTNLPTGGIFGKVSSFVQSVLNANRRTNTESAETTLPDPKGSEITVRTDYPLLPLTDEGNTLGNHPLLGPSALLHQSLLTAYGRVYTSRPNRILTARMEDILYHMECFSSSNTFAPKPDHNMFIILMRHYGQIKGISRAIAEKSDALLQNIGTSSSFSDGAVTTDTIMLVMRAYSRVKQSLPSALRCKALLKRLEEAESNGESHMTPTTEAYNLCLRAFLKVSSIESNRVRDEVISHTEEILSSMVDRHKRGMQNGTPNTMTYNLAIAIVSAASSQLEHLGKVLGWIEYLEREYLSYRRQQHDKVKIEEESSNGTKTETLMGPPSTFAYNAYLQAALSHAKVLDDKVKQDKLIETVERLYNNMVCHGVSKPDYTTFETLFQIYRRSKGLVDAGERAEALLSRMEVQYATGRNSIVKPDARMYYYAITCWSSEAAQTTRKVNAAARAYIILKTMELQASIGNDELKLTKHSVSAVIHVCSCTTHLDYQPEALRIAFECYNNMILQGIKPSAITYSCLLNCCATLVHDPIKRDKLARQLFATACEQGQVNGVVETTLRKASIKLYRLYKKHGSDKKEHSAKVPRALKTG